MSIKIVCDSSSNVFTVPGLRYAAVPMKIIAAREYVDTPELDVAGMVEDLKHFKSKSGSSCPNVQDWLDAFGDAETVFGITITKYLSGSYNSAMQAAETYMEEHPGRQVFIFDSLSAGPELMLLAEKINELAGADFETIRDTVLDYKNHNHTLFCLESMMNLARNGRVNPIVAKVAGTLGIRVIGTARGGQIAAIHKPRGSKKALQLMVQEICDRGFADGNKLRISHCFAAENARALADAVREKFPAARITIEPTSALCSFYAESGGLIAGFEGSYNEANSNREF